MLSFNQPALDLSEFSVGGREQAWFDVFAWSGRDLYRPGETVRVSRVKGNEDMKHHLKDLGFVEGNEIHVVSSSGANIIVTVLGARFGIDSKVAMHIMTVG